MAFNGWMTKEKLMLIQAKLQQIIGNKGPVSPELDDIMDIVGMLGVNMRQITAYYRKLEGSMVWTRLKRN